jgi:biotin carboxyl carrier protein
MKFETIINDVTTSIDLDKDNKSIFINDRHYQYDFEEIGENRFLLRTGFKTYILDNVTVNGSVVEFTLNGKWIKTDVKDEQALLLSSLGFKVGAGTKQGNLTAPMPGKILNIMAKQGEKIEAGSPAVVLEAMKMENELKAPLTGIIKNINAEVGQSVEKNHLILEIEPIG